MIDEIVYGAMHGYSPLASLVATRIHQDYAGQKPTAPYVVWWNLATVPSNHISGRPMADRYSISVDVYAASISDRRDVLLAARDAMEAIGKMKSGPQSLGRDEATNLWRATFTVDVFQNR